MNTNDFNKQINSVKSRLECAADDRRYEGQSAAEDQLRMAAEAIEDLRSYNRSTPTEWDTPKGQKVSASIDKMLDDCRNGKYPA